MKTRDSLYIINRFYDGPVEVQGMFLYALFAGEVTNVPAADEFKKVWKTSEIECKVTRCGRLPESEYEMLCVDIYLKALPPSEAWYEQLTVAMAWLIEQGAFVVWCCDEYGSPYPAILSGEGRVVYACYTPSAGLTCNAGLDDEMVYLDDEQMSEAWELVKQYLPIFQNP